MKITSLLDVLDFTKKAVAKNLHQMENLLVDGHDPCNSAVPSTRKLKPKPALLFVKLLREMVSVSQIFLSKSLIWL